MTDATSWRTMPISATRTSPGRNRSTSDADGALLREAVAEHLGNFHMPDFITEFRFTDDRAAL